MLALWAVTGFTRYVRVTAKLFLIDNVGVAAFADFVAGEGGCAGSDLGDGITAIVTVLSKALWDDCGAEDDEGQQRQQHHDTKADEMFDVLEHDCLSEPEWGSASSPLRHVIWDTGDRLSGR